MPAGIALHRGNHQMDKLYVVMPTYNEEANIRDVVRSWYPVLEGKNDESRLVIADGGSKDKTLEILHELEKEYPPARRNQHAGDRSRDESLGPL